MKKNNSQLLVDISARLRQERERLGKTLEEFAAATDMGKLTAGRYETGERCPDATYLAELERQFGAEVQFIVTGQKQMKKSALASSEAELLDRYRNLPAALQSYIDKSALLAWLAFQDRKGYHLNEGKL